MNSARIVRTIRIVLGTTCLMIGLAGCARDPTAVVPMGSIEVTTTTTGRDIGGAYTVCVQECVGAAPNGTVSFVVPAGQQVVGLLTGADNCSVQGANPRTVMVTAGQAVQTTFMVTCAPVTGSIEVTTSTTGADSTPYIYWLELDGGWRGNIGTSSRVVFQSILAGTHTVALRGLPQNCTVGDVNPRSVTFAPTETAAVAFAIGCTSPVGNKLAVAHLDIFSKHADNTGFANLTRNAATNRQPAWDPTGTRITFVSSFDIHVMNADGSHPILLTATPALEERFPMWSPDGTRIAFVGNTPTGDWFLSIMDADGSHPLRLATSSETRPAWSPDGTKIVFSRKLDGDNWDIYVVGADGAGLTNLTNSPSADLDPVWSPDGSQIAFSSDRSGDPEIYVLRLDGAGLVRLTRNPGLDDQPQWSPDGSRIAFRRGMDGGIYVIGPTGSNEVKITWGGNPRWSPDGTRIAFVRPGGFVGCGEWGCYYAPAEVNVVAVDGGLETNLLTFLPSDAVTEIEWSPRR